MPCHTDWSAAERATDRAWRKLKKLLDEVGLAYPSEDLSEQEYLIRFMSPKLCAWCQTADVTQQSLELQIWWRDHQKADRRHAREAQKEKREKALRQSGLKKLTRAERRVLGV